jgi:hypothetical protein
LHSFTNNIRHNIVVLRGGIGVAGPRKLRDIKQKELSQRKLKTMMMMMMMKMQCVERKKSAVVGLVTTNTTPKKSTTTTTTICVCVYSVCVTLLCTHHDETIDTRHSS